MNEGLLLIIIIAYISIITGIGLYARKKVTSPTSFFLANRSLKTFPLTATITATTIGGSATIVAGGRIFADGLPAIWYDLGGAIGLFILGISMAKLVRKTNCYTLPDIINKLYDKKTRHIAAILIIITEIAWVALLIQAASFILSVILPLDSTILLIGITIAFVLYTIIGGQFAVVYTDIIQFIIMMVGICFIATPLLLTEAAPYWSLLSYSQVSFPINENIGFLSMGSIFFMMMMPHIVGPDIYAKILSAKNEKSARNATILSAFFKFVFAICIALIALAATLIPSIQEQISTPALAIPIALTTLPIILSGLVLAAFLSVMISSADSCLLSAGTILSVDILKNNSIKTSQIGIIIVGLSALSLAIYHNLLGSILDTLELAYTVFTAGLTLPVIFGLYQKQTKVTAKGALYSIILGGSSSIISLQIPRLSNYAVLIGLIASLIPLIVFRYDPNHH
ncbi:MAG TPA: sodium:solute symporter family protein [Candidatus Thermoplasmatota archaeon]|nr:sodium:solute symporter family protein [Candidatus Thermoplasmatota archaeon]